MAGDRLARVRRAVAAASPGPGLDLVGVGRACTTLVGVDGAGVIRVADDGLVLEVVHVSDSTIERIEDLHYVLGEGPCIDACVLGIPVLEPDLTRTGTTRWVRFVAEVLAGGVGAVFCFPLHIGAIRFGSLNLYRRRAGGLSDDQLADALVLADVTTDIVLETESPILPVSRIAQMVETGPYGARVHQATGMVAAQAGVGTRTALVRLRAHAFASGRSLALVAADVVDRRLRFD